MVPSLKPWLRGSREKASFTICRHFSRRGSGPDPRRTVDHRFEQVEKTPEVLMQTQMYTPESLKSDGLATNCYRMVEFGLAEPSLLNRYGERAAELASGLTPSEFSRILAAFARAAHRHEGMLMAFKKHVPRRLPQFLPLHLAHGTAAFATLQERDEELFQRFSAEIPHKLPLFETWQLLSVAHAYARLRFRDELLLDDIADEFVRKPQDLDGPSLALLANSFARFRIRTPKFWATMAEWLTHTYIDLSASQATMALNALSAVDFRHEPFVVSVTHLLVQEPFKSELHGFEVAGICNAIAKLDLGERCSEALLELVQRALVMVPDMDSRQTSQMLHATTKLRVLREQPQLIEDLVGRSRALLQEMNAQQLSVLVYCCATLQIKDPPLLARVAKAALPLAKHFTPQGLGMLAHGYAKLEARSEVLFYILANEMIEKIQLFQGRTLAMILTAFGKLRISNERLVAACRKQTRELYGELSLSEIHAIEAGFRALDALDATTEAALRRARRAAAEHSPADPFSSHDRHLDPWDAEEDRMLQRLLEETPHRSLGSARQFAVPATEPAQPEVKEVVPSRRAPHSGEKDLTPDLWALWDENDNARSASSAEVSDARTSRSRLKEYLAQPERPGRRPVILERDDGGGWEGPAGAGLVAPSDIVEESAEVVGRGRKRSRVQKE